MKIIRAGAYEAFYDMPLQIDWALTTRCNYRCSYCFYYGYGNKNTPPQLPFSTLKQLKAAVNNIASLNRPHYDIIFTGGEPTLHPHIIDLIYLLHEALQDRLRELLIISNGSRNNELYRKLAEIAKEVNISMQISIHTDHVDMQHILELIENLSHDVNLYFPLMFNPAKREEVHLIYDIMYEYRKRFPFYLEVQTVYMGGYIDPRYTPEDLRWRQETFKHFRALDHVIKLEVPRKSSFTYMQAFHDIEDNGERKIIETTDYNSNVANGLADFNGMYCTAHTANLRIEENGFCKGLICPLDPYICNIYEENSLRAVRDELIHGVYCNGGFPCTCPNSNYPPKFASREEAIRFIEIFRAKQKALFDAFDAAH